MLGTDIVLVNVQDRLGSEGFVMPVKHWSCLQFLNVVFTVILSLLVHCVLLTYILLYGFMLAVKNCTLTVCHKNQWFGAWRPKQLMAI
jgi:type III secretory pathway component EscU